MKTANVFTIQTLLPHLKRRWLTIFDVFVVDFFFSSYRLPSTTDNENAIITLWRKEFAEDIADENAMPTVAQIRAVSLFHEFFV